MDYNRKLELAYDNICKKEKEQQKNLIFCKNLRKLK